MTELVERDELEAEASRLLAAGLRREPDPRFLLRLRGETRGRHARLTHQLAWFDLGFDLGPLRVVHDGELVHMVTNDPGRFRDRAGAELGFVPDSGEAPKVRERAAKALTGKIRGTEVAYLGEMPPFHRHVLEATAAIPRGEVRPYAWVAREAGTPGAVRAAGTALAHNPVPFIVPCHRVLKSDWELGHYSAGGSHVKERVLAHEGVQVARLAGLRKQHLRFIGHAGDTFCIPGCGGAWESVDDHREFHSVDEAMSAGYQPCSDCRPA